VTRGWLPQRAGSPIPVGSEDAAAVPPGGTQQPGLSYYIFSSLCLSFHWVLIGFLTWANHGQWKLMSAKLHYMDTGYGHVVQHTNGQAHDKLQMLYNTYTSLGGWLCCTTSCRLWTCCTTPPTGELTILQQTKICHISTSWHVEMFSSGTAMWQIRWTTSCRIVVSLSVGGVVQHVRSRCPCSGVWHWVVTLAVYWWHDTVLDIMHTSRWTSYHCTCHSNKKIRRLSPVQQLSRSQCRKLYSSEWVSEWVVSQWHISTRCHFMPQRCEQYDNRWDE